MRFKAFIRYLKYLGLAILGTLFIYFLLSLFLDPIITIYNVAAQTERLQFKTLDNNISRYNLLNAQVIDYDAEELLENFNGSLKLNSGITLDFERISSGPIIITIFSEDGKSIGNFYQGSDGELLLEAPDFINIFFEPIDSLLHQGIGTVFPISGTVNLGRSVGFEVFGESSPLLREGNITMTGYSSWSNSYFEAGNSPLSMGDYLIFEDEDKMAFGFLTINENPGLQVAYRVEALEARVIKPGPRDANSGYPISASLYDRFMSDRLFQSISLLFAGLILATTLVTFYMDVILFRQDTQKKIKRKKKKK